MVTPDPQPRYGYELAKVVEVEGGRYRVYRNGSSYFEQDPMPIKRPSMIPFYIFALWVLSSYGAWFWMEMNRPPTVLELKR